MLVSAPWDVTVSYGAGTALAPDALIEASTQLDLYDASAPGAWLGGIATADIDYSLQEESRKLRADAERVIEHLEEGGAPDDERIERRLRRINEGCAAMNDNIYRQARQWLSQGKVVGLVGGDHSTPYGLIRAVAEKEGSLGILHIDAHCDLREAYEGFGIFARFDHVQRTARPAAGEQARAGRRAGLLRCRGRKGRFGRADRYVRFALARSRRIRGNDLGRKLPPHRGRAARGGLYQFRHRRTHHRTLSSYGHSRSGRHHF